MFSISPEIFYAIYMVFTISKFILRMFYSIVCFGSIINQAIVSLPAIRVNNTPSNSLNSDNMGISSFAEQF